MANTKQSSPSKQTLDFIALENAFYDSLDALAHCALQEETHLNKMANSLKQNKAEALANNQALQVAMQRTDQILVLMDAADQLALIEPVKQLRSTKAAQKSRIKTNTAKSKQTDAKVEEFDLSDFFTQDMDFDFFSESENTANTEKEAVTTN